MKFSAVALPLLAAAALAAPPSPSSSPAEARAQPQAGPATISFFSDAQCQRPTWVYAITAACLHFPSDTRAFSWTGGQSPTFYTLPTCNGTSTVSPSPRAGGPYADETRRSQRASASLMTCRIGRSGSEFVLDRAWPAVRG